MPTKNKWDDQQVKRAISFLRQALECIKTEAPLSFKEALDHAERAIQRAREEQNRYTDACCAAGQIEASPEALYYRRYGRFPPKKKKAS